MFCLLHFNWNLPVSDCVRDLETRVPIVSDNFSRNCFFALRTRLKLIDDNSVSTETTANDRKVRSILDRIQNERLSNVSIVEEIISCHVIVLMSQRVRGKQNLLRLRNFVITISTEKFH